MRGDFSRLTFDALKHYTSVLHQQGRVWLDADWNEDVLDREYLLQQETVDIIGRCGVPAPHTGFAISPGPDPESNPGDFRIGGGPGPQGRYYVDGLMCQLDRDATYLNQPDFPDPPPISMPDEGHQLYAIVYLETWQRLITYLEDEALQEIALGGPDTATRLRTIAQVKVQPLPQDAGQVTCENAAEFLPHPSQGTLTTLPPVDVPPGDPCRIPDPGSYTGRENHLYRVEIHTGGDVTGGAQGNAFRLKLAEDAPRGSLNLTLSSILTGDQARAALNAGVITLVDERGHSETLPLAGVSKRDLKLGRGLTTAFAAGSIVIGGTAHFKWSRDNAAFAVRVTGVKAEDRRTLTLASLGRDQITALRQGDLIEVSDDASELGPARGHLTYLTADPDPDSFTVTLAEALPANFRIDQLDARHLVLRRWDGSGMAAAAFGETTTPDMNLGDGVHIQFGGFYLQPGDFWVFAARTADGSVERLDDAPPLGIIRHRCVLAIIRWQAVAGYDPKDVLEAYRKADFNSEQFAQAAKELQALIEQTGQLFVDAATVEAIARNAGVSDGQIELVRRILQDVSIQRRLVLTVLEDCRRPFDSLTECRCGGECEVTVAPGESLRAAIDKIGPEGGVVCLRPGIYALPETLLVSGKHGLTIRGAGAASVVTAGDLPIAMRFADCDNLVLRDFTIIGGQLAGENSKPPGLNRTHPVDTLQPASPPDQAGSSEARANDARSDLSDLVVGVITLLECRAVEIDGCTVVCAGLEQNPQRWCIAFLGQLLPQPDRTVRLTRFAAAPEVKGGSPAAAPDAGLAGENEEAAAPHEAGESATTPHVLAADLRTRIADLVRLRAISSRATSTTEAPTGATVTGPAEAVPIPTVPIVINQQQVRRLSIDLAVRRCRMFTDLGQSGLAVHAVTGVFVADNWVLPFSALDEFGLNVIPNQTEPKPGLSYGLAFSESGLVEVRNNRVIALKIGLIVSDSGNQTRQSILPFRTLRLVGNVIFSQDGPSGFIDSRSDEVHLQGNVLVGVPLPAPADEQPQLAVSAQIGAVAEIRSEAANLSHNRFQTGSLVQRSLAYAVGVQAANIIYTGNRSVCDALPGLTNVLLYSDPGNDPERQSGSITAVSNVCREPQPEPPPQTVEDLRARAQSLMARIAMPAALRPQIEGLVARPLTLEALRKEFITLADAPDVPIDVRSALRSMTQPSAPQEAIEVIRKNIVDLESRQRARLHSYIGGEVEGIQFRQQVEEDNQTLLQLHEQLAQLNQAIVQQERISLLVMAGVTVTGMNLLSYRLLRSGRGTDQGSETGVF